MIKTLITVAALALTGLLSAPRAEAGHSHTSITYRSGFTSCGSPIYTRRYVRGYDRCGRPVFGYARVPVTRAYRQRPSPAPLTCASRTRPSHAPVTRARRPRPSIAHPDDEDDGGGGGPSVARTPSTSSEDEREGESDWFVTEDEMSE